VLVLRDYRRELIDDLDRLLARGIIDDATDAVLRDGICIPLIVSAPGRLRLPAH
jgi:hypothetical protein